VPCVRKKLPVAGFVDEKCIKVLGESMMIKISSRFVEKILHLIVTVNLYTSEYFWYTSEYLLIK
jgi:hypothetical protein